MVLRNEGLVGEGSENVNMWDSSVPFLRGCARADCFMPLACLMLLMDNVCLVTFLCG